MHPPLRRPIARLHAVRLMATYAAVAALLDLVLAAAYWQPQAGPSALLNAIARWVLGAEANGSAVSLAVGALVHWLLYGLGMLATRVAVRWRWQKHGSTGAVFAVVAGTLVYLLLFQVVVPLLAWPLVPDRSPGWVAACVAVHALVIGPLLVHGAVRIERRRRADPGASTLHPIPAGTRR